MFCAVFMLKNQRQSVKPLVIISTSGVQELNVFQRNEYELFIGSHISMSQFENILTDVHRWSGQWRFSI